MCGPGGARHPARMNRSARAAVAHDTLAVLERGTYEIDGRSVDLRADLRACRDGTVRYDLPDAPTLLAALRSAPRGPTAVEVRPESTLAAARRLARETGREPGALNFASARNPGGGFLGGSQAQEESLARASGLYHALTGEAAAPFYAAHRHADGRYSDRLLHSPGVPVFRDDADRPTPDVTRVGFVTAAAPNAGALRRNAPHLLPEVPEVLRTRAALVLGAFARHGHREVVLGAWGCGVFRNDPREVAGVFRDLLEGEARGMFDRVVFAVLDGVPDAPTLRAFREAFGG